VGLLKMSQQKSCEPPPGVLPAGEAAYAGGGAALCDVFDLVDAAMKSARSAAR
jgi:hypothetical protein